MIDSLGISWKKLPSNESHGTLLMTSQSCFNLWLGAVRQKKTLNHCWPDLCRYMVPPGHEFIEVGVEDKFVKALQQCTWWRHQMQTLPALLAICVGNSPVTGEFPAQRSATRSFGVFLVLGLNKRFSKQSWGWWFETPPRPLWHQCNVAGETEKQRGR